MLIYYFLHNLLGASLCLMGLIDVIEPLSTVLSGAANKSKQHHEKNSWEYRESNPGLLGEKQ